MPETERYNTRNVAQKEVYDSYMGILRISPISLNDSDIDDPTQFVNALYDEEKQERMKIILSDSDGNVLPVKFSPRAFEQKVSLPVSNGLSSATTVDVINMATVLDRNLYVSKKMQVRSIVRVEPEYTENNTNHSFFTILSGALSSSSGNIEGNGLLLYPSESPNDENYFNIQNSLSLFDENSDVPRYKQVDDTLYEKTKAWHYENIEESERVKVLNGTKPVIQMNLYNEEIPVYYTHDYILGHYDSHSFKTEFDNNALNQWGINGKQNDAITKHITKLSWTRIDKLIWESLNEILSGNVRHIKGRYDELGMDEIADPGIRHKLGFGQGNEYKDFAPILGTEYARGLISYHAMPFHRYWFHRTKQVLRNFIERKKNNINILSNYNPEDNPSLDDYIISTGLLYGDAFENNNELIKDEIENIKSYYDDKLLTPNPMGTVGFIHSLSKNFILCNGNDVTFKNFPNLSLTNDLFFEIETEGNLINTAKYSSDDGFVMKNNKTSEDINVLKAMIDSQSSGSDYLKLPNLFALYEKTPRFIRGLNWFCDNNEESNIVTVYNPMITDSNKTTYVGEKTSSTNKKRLQIQKDKDYRLPKILTAVDKVHFHTYDHLVEKETHRHNMFSDIEGGVGKADEATKDPGYLKTLLHHYHCRNTRGGHIAHLNKWLFLKMMNYDKTCSQSACVTYSSTSGYRISTNQSSGQSEKDWQKDGKNWTKYCLGGIYDGDLHCKFTPIPTTSLYIFNASIYNNRGHLDKLILKKNSNKVTGEITDANRDTEIDNTQRGTWKTNKIIVNEKDGTSTTFTEGLEYESDKYFYMGADGKKHKLSEAPISIDRFRIDDNNIKLADTLIEHAKQIERRKWWARKANEAEGFIPISFAGKAGGRIILSWSRDERSGSKSSSRNTYEDNKYNIASYIMTPDEGYDEEKSFWRCWSSIAYTNSAKLGVGNITNYIENKNKFDEEADYYDTNLVTLLPDEQKYKTYKFGGADIFVDETCPSPNNLKLLPLIRI